MGMKFSLRNIGWMKLLKLTVLMGFIFTIFVAGYVIIEINNLKRDIELTKTTRKEVAQDISNLEGGTKVKKYIFDNYLLYSDQNSYTGFKKDLIENKTLQYVKSEVHINENFELPKLRENTCNLFRCIQNRRPFHEIPSGIWKALLGTEDFRFLDHRGVDPIAITRAIIVDIIAMKFIQGGSTLTQQLVKNLYLTNEKKLKRKVKEIIYALYIENILKKEDIITLYLNEVFWTAYQGVKLKGFHSASLAYFNKTPQELDEFESTILVSFLKGPNYYHPVRGLNRVKKRVSAVYKRLQSINLVSKDPALIWDDAKWESWSKDFEKRNKLRNFYSYYLASKNDDNYIDSFDKITLYESIAKVKNNLKPRVKEADIGIKILIADKECEDYECRNIFSYYSKFERDKRKALTTEYHQVGSLFKPIVYESFIELGRDYDEMISTKPITLKLKSGSWTPKDYSKAKIEEIQLKVALQKSKNIPLIRVADEIGFEKLEENLKKKIPRLMTPLREFPAQLLGALELSLEEVISSYAKFFISKCKEISENSREFEKTILYYMSVASETTISKLARPPLKHANVFGKTGTSNNGLDNWYFAFDGKTVYVFWYGVESKRNEHDLKLSGAISSYMIFQDYMNYRGKQISEVICE